MARPASSGQSAPKPSGTRPNGQTTSAPKDRSQSILNSAKKGKK